MMLLEGITCHESTKRKLDAYAIHHGTPEKPVRIVKPFMLVVCKDTDHATWVESFIKSEEFRGGAYRNKTIADAILGLALAGVWARQASSVGVPFLRLEDSLVATKPAQSALERLCERRKAAVFVVFPARKVLCFLSHQYEFSWGTET